MKRSFTLLTLCLLSASIFLASESFASRYSKKKPPIGQMMLGGLEDPKSDHPKAESTPASAAETKADAQPQKEAAATSEKK